MQLDLINAAPKVHPASRAVEPEDPMDLHGVEVDGNPEFMLRMLVEDYARMGCGLDELMELCQQPFYVAMNGLLQHFGEEELRQKVSNILTRCGVFRVTVRETTPISEQLVPLDVSRFPDHGDRAKKGRES
jgi:hypothetical protein